MSEIGIESEKIANRIVGAFIIEPCNKARGLTEEWIAAALLAAEERGRVAEREACAMVAESLGDDNPDFEPAYQFVAAAIRARASTDHATNVTGTIFVGGEPIATNVEMVIRNPAPCAAPTSVPSKGGTFTISSATAPASTDKDTE